MKKYLVISFCLLFLLEICLCFSQVKTKNPDNLFPTKKHDFNFKNLAKSWDEGIPLGNGMIGSLIWQKEKVLRFSLDRADLWDFRMPKEFETPEFKFSWVVSQALKGDYSPVQKLFDLPYDRDATPTKIPAAGLEFNIPNVGDIESIVLSLKQAVCTIKWKSGIILTTFVHATENSGWFVFENLNEKIKPEISAPPYVLTDTSTLSGISGPSGNDLRRLNYPIPKINAKDNEITYHQECSEGFAYDVWVGWKYLSNNKMVGCWKINPNRAYKLNKDKNNFNLKDITEENYKSKLKTHIEWWNNFWNKSSIQIPDELLETQYYREMYKFGSSSRRGAPPITLQAVWTADNSRLPPWKGDFHNDLNTQLSYWSSYSANHLEESLAFTDWLWDCKFTAEKYTKGYFEVDGLNFPGVSTLTGDPMGGWIQYSLSPTVSVWLAHHFYLQWRFSMDNKFLAERAYPWLKSVATFIDNISVRDDKGKRKLPLSSSPEINDNSLNAWFKNITNFDLSLILWLYNASSEMAIRLGKNDEAKKWSAIRSEWPAIAVSPENNKLLVAPEIELKESHRHFSHLMAIHPLGLIDWDKNDLDKKIIKSSIADLDRLGPDLWCGYSYSWLGSMAARGRDGDKAAEALKIFATCFCLQNSFHVNGDQSGTGKSKFTYRPFTLEGNFAFASGIQEMLLQSHNNLIRIFPAIPKSWKDLSFSKLRTEGAFIVSAIMKNGKIESLKIYSEKGEKLRLLNPFDNNNCKIIGAKINSIDMKKDIIEIDTKQRQEIIFTLSEKE